MKSSQELLLPLALISIIQSDLYLSSYLDQLHIDQSRQVTVEEEASAFAAMLAPSTRQPILRLHRVYVGVSELWQMRLSQGSPLLTAVLQNLKEPLEMWEPVDPGVDAYGFYELVALPETASGDSHRLLPT